MTFDFYISLLRSVRLVLSKNIMDGNQNKGICNDFLKTPYKNLRNWWGFYVLILFVYLKVKKKKVLLFAFNFYMEKLTDTDRTSGQSSSPTPYFPPWCSTKVLQRTPWRGSGRSFVPQTGTGRCECVGTAGPSAGRESPKTSCHVTLGIPSPISTVYSLE